MDNLGKPNNALNWNSCPTTTIVMTRFLPFKMGIKSCMRLLTQQIHLNAMLSEAFLRCHAKLKKTMERRTLCNLCLHRLILQLAKAKMLIF